MAENRSFDDLLTDRLENSPWAIQAKQADDAATAVRDQDHVDQSRERVRKLRREIVTPQMNAIAAQLNLGRNKVSDGDAADDVCESWIATTSNRTDLELRVQLSAVADSLRASVLCRTAERFSRTSGNWSKRHDVERDFLLNDAEMVNFSDWLHGHLLECAALMDAAIQS